MAPHKTDAAVSESVGFILISSIMLIAFAMIYLVGLPIYNGYIDNNHIQNVQENFDIIAHNGNDVAMLKSPIESSEINMYGGSMLTRSTGYMEISAYGSAGETIDDENFTLTILEYTRNADSVAYIDGSVCKTGPAGSLMIREPMIYSDANTLSIQVISVFESSVSVSGKGMVHLMFQTPYYSKIAQTVSSPGPTITSNVYTVKIKMDGDYSDAFGRYFEDELGFTASTDANGDLIMTKTYASDITLIVSQEYLSVKSS